MMVTATLDAVGEAEIAGSLVVCGVARLHAAIDKISTNIKTVAIIVLNRLCMNQPYQPPSWREATPDRSLIEA